uniref:Uncharacterized protein n=1 Tax=Paramormyrops kingsleyae TaxID=1676925 RepID=A0A3B3R312_9TELE
MQTLQQKAPPQPIPSRQTILQVPIYPQLPSVSWGVYVYHTILLIVLIYEYNRVILIVQGYSTNKHFYHPGLSNHISQSASCNSITLCLKQHITRQHSDTRGSARTPAPQTRGGARTPAPQTRGGARAPGPQTRGGARTPAPQTRGGARAPAPQTRGGARTPAPQTRGGARTPAPQTRAAGQCPHPVPGADGPVVGARAGPNDLWPKSNCHPEEPGGWTKPHAHRPTSGPSGNCSASSELHTSAQSPPATSLLAFLHMTLWCASPSPSLCMGA